MLNYNKRQIIFLYFLITGISVAFFSCTKTYNDSIDGETVDERLTQALKDYQHVLTAAPFGWKFMQRTNSAYNNGAFDSVVNTFTYYMTFDDKNTVTMYGDFDSLQRTTPRSSTYLIKALQRPTIVFDTRNYIHVPSDPSPTVSQSTLSPGLGWGTDFQFEFAQNVDASALGDTIRLKGMFNRAEGLMVKATQADRDLFASGEYYNRLQEISNLNKVLTYWKRMTINAVTYELGPPNFLTKQMNINWVDGNGNLIMKRVAFYYDFDGAMHFVEPVINGNTSITGLSGFQFDTGTGSVNVRVVGANVNSTIVPATAALKYDSTVAQKWLNQLYLNFNGVWVSDKAFHANGIDDACDFKSIPNYQTFWFGGPSIFGGTSHGICAFVNNDLANTYSYAFSPPDIANGRVKFTLQLNSGTFTGNSPLARAMSSARQLMYGGAVFNSSQEFYFVATSPDGKAYDMVRYPDATVWISWRPR